MGVRGRLEWRDRAGHVPFVAATDIGEDFGLVGDKAGELHFPGAAPRPDFGSRGDENLDLGAGADDRADIAAIKDGAGGARGEFPLQLEQGSADFGDGGYDRGSFAGGVAFK